MTARHVFYEGRVQGVGFRYTVKQVAAGFDVVGWVRNLPDGRVEMVAGGEAEELEAFLTAILESELNSFIKNEHRETFPAIPELKRFEIRF